MIDKTQPRREIGDMTAAVNLDYLGIKNEDYLLIGELVTIVTSSFF